MHWQYTPYIVPLLIATLISLTIARYTWQRRATLEAKTFLWLAILVAVWTFGYALELAGVDLATKIFWAKAQYLAIATLPLVWLMFAVQYIGKGAWITRKSISLLAVVPIITIILVWTNEAHGLVWKQTRLDANGPFPALQVEYGAWFWLYSAFSYLLLLGGTLVLFSILRRSTHLYRRQISMLLVGGLAPWVGNGIYLTGLSPIPNLDLTPFAFTISGIAIAYGLFRYHFLDVLPIARRAVMEGMRDGVVVLDTQNRVVDINPAAQRAVKRHSSAVLGQTIDQLFADWPDLVDRFRDVTEVVTEIAINNNHKQRWLELTISPLYSKRKQLIGRLVVFHDITKRKQAEAVVIRARDQALAASRLKSEFLARISHELRTPLNAILGHTELFEMGVYGDITDKQKQATQKIINNCTNLTHLVNELLDQASLESGKLILNNNAFTATDLIKPIQTKINGLAKVKEIKLTTWVSPDLPETLHGDLYRLQQVLSNLVGNAVKFTESGWVQIDLTYVDDAHWAMQVSDTGPGIPLDAHEYIFDPFRQVDGSLTRLHGGTGLGLSIVKDLTTLMGGQVVLDSRPGQGSTFTVILPFEPVEQDDILG